MIPDIDSSSGASERPKKIQPMFNAWKKQDQDASLIRVQWKLIMLLFGLCTLITLGWMSAPSRLRIFIPPDMSSAVTQKADSIAAPSVYSFAYQVWRSINEWPQNGGDDYKLNIRTYWYYLSPQFQSDLLQDQTDLQASGQLQRQRYVQGVAGAAYDPANVKQLNKDTWEVDLKMRLTEYANHQIVKDVEIIYPLKVTRMDIAERLNPYGLVLAGFVSEPQRLKVYV